MLKRCVVVKPAGRNHNKYGDVEWYDVPARRLIDDYFNVGDMYVYDSTLRLVDFDTYEHVNIDEPVDPARVEQLRDFDCILLRASNYLHPYMDWTNFEAWLGALRLPVICCGIGAQSARREPMVLPEEQVRIWHMIAERCQSVGVRGVFTAETLAGIGIHNVDIVGCPTIFRGLSPVVEMRAPPVAGNRLAFSIRRETGPGYTEDASAFLGVQRALIERFDREFDLWLTAHGEPEEKVLYYQDSERLEAVVAEFQQSGWFAEGSALERLYREHLLFSTRVADYDGFNRTVGGTIGYRVHGVLPALALGTPSVLLRYDARSAELAETLSVPLLSPEDALSMSTADIFSPGRFDRFSADFPGHYGRMKDFLDRNSVPNRM